MVVLVNEAQARPAQRRARVVVQGRAVFSGDHHPAFVRRLKQAGRVAALRSCVMTSGRRWERHGPLRTILLMWKLRLLFFLGVSPDRLKRLYVDAR